MSASRTLLALVVAGALAGCGLGAGSAPGGVRLTVSTDFGASVMRQSATPSVRGSETVMSLLMRNDPVTTRYSGGFVQSIAGRSGGQSAGAPSDWFYYVNGVEAPKGAAETVVHAGDRIWWDLHDWSLTDHVPAVVGSFPEPFLHGVEGRRLPVRVECAEVQGGACRTVVERLRALGVPAAISAVTPGEASATLRVLVGPWAALAGDPAAQSIGRGPVASGVFVNVAGRAGRASAFAFALLDPRGRVAQTLGAGAGLIAATRYGEGAPLWVITGADAAGVSAAAGAFDRRSLENRFAIALSGPGAALALPRPGA